MMVLCPILSRGQADRMIPPTATTEGIAPPVIGVVGPVWQVDSGVHPYPQHLLPRTVST
jgi:hypothetical protein